MVFSFLALMRRFGYSVVKEQSLLRVGPSCPTNENHSKPLPKLVQELFSFAGDFVQPPKFPPLKDRATRVARLYKLIKNFLRENHQRRRPTLSYIGC